MNASNGLHFDAGVQRGLHQDHVVRSREVEPRCASPSSHADEEHGGGRVVHKALDDVAGSRFKHSTGCDASFGEMSVCSLEEAGVVGKDAELGSVLLRVRSLSLSFFTGDGAHDLIQFKFIIQIKIIKVRRNTAASRSGISYTSSSMRISEDVARQLRDRVIVPERAAQDLQ